MEISRSCVEGSRLQPTVHVSEYTADLQAHFASILYAELEHVLLTSWGSVGD